MFFPGTCKTSSRTHFWIPDMHGCLANGERRCLFFPLDAREAWMAEPFYPKTLCVSRHHAPCGRQVPFILLTGCVDGWKKHSRRGPSESILYLHNPGNPTLFTGICLMTTLELGCPCSRFQLYGTASRRDMKDGMTHPVLRSRL